MKPARFGYRSPRTLDEAVAILRDEPDAKVIAGGQSLVPLMSFRLARPSVLVDINRIPGMNERSVDGSAFCVGGLTRHVDLERHPGPGALGALLPRVAKAIGHLPIRTRGTFGGSLAHADPAAEWCVVARTLDAEIVVHGSDGAREIAVDEFFSTVFTTALQPSEIIREVRLPLLSDHHGVGFSEFSRRAGDFALVLAVAVVAVQAGSITDARLGIGGAGDVPVRVTVAEQGLIGRPPSEEALREAARTAAEAVDPLEDIHAGVAYRRSLVEVMSRRALAQAVATT